MKVLDKDNLIAYNLIKQLQTIKLREIIKIKKKKDEDL